MKSKRVAVMAMAAAFPAGWTLGQTRIAPDHPALSYSDYAFKDVSSERARFDRVIEEPNGFRHDNPGTRVRFRTNSRHVSARLASNALHRREQWEGSGFWTRDGKSAGTFQTPSQRPNEFDIVLAKDGGGEEHDYEIVLPYGDSVDFLGLQVDSGARLSEPAPRPAIRYVAYGDSITHGFSASNVQRTYPFLLGERKGWQVINMGFGSREATAEDGLLVADLSPDVVTVCMGFNDFYRSKSLVHYKQDIGGFVANVRKKRPDVPIYILTPLWSSEPLQGEIGLTLEDYRTVVREVIGEINDPQVYLVEGPDLTAHDLSCFPDGIHPNDEGFRQIAEGLAKQVVVP